MFDQFKEKIHSVQQDLNAGLKTLGEKAREVGRSKKLPGELHVLESKQGILSALKPECVDAGEEILNRFQQLWTQVHINIEYSADKAMKADKVIQDTADQHEKDIQTLRQLYTQVHEVPDMVVHIQTLVVTLGKLEANFEEIESMLDNLEDTCEEEELLNNKRMQITELMRYKDQKVKEREIRREHLLDEYNQRFRRVEEREDAKKKERQRAFQDVFAADMDHYRTHGKMSKPVMQISKDVGSTLDDFELTVSEDEQQALDDFLGPDEDVELDGQSVSIVTRDVEGNDDETEETEETATETDEGERTDVTKTSNGTQEPRDGSDDRMEMTATMTTRQEDDPERVGETERTTESTEKQTEPECRQEVSVDEDDDDSVVDGSEEDFDTPDEGADEEETTPLS